MHRSLFEKQMSRLGIHRSQHRILMYLAEHPDLRPSQKEIAEVFHISSAAVAVTIKKLESGGYITKSVLQKDNRVNEVCITPKAIAIVEQTKEIAKKMEQNIFADFSKDELEAFGICLEKMQTAMKEYDRNERKA